MPHFMACPSTTTFITAVILFLTGIIRLNYHNRNNAWLPIFMISMFSSTAPLIEWKRFFASLQMLAPIRLWVSRRLAVLHPIFRWALPGWYTRTEAKLKKIQGELVRSVHQLGQPGELAESRVREEALSG